MDFMNFLKRVYIKLRSLFGINDLTIIQNSFFTKDIFKDKKYIIGDFTYGHPIIIFENDDANLFIGKYCSIAEGVTIFLGGNHRQDWITTYPFNALPMYFLNSNKILGHPSTNGNVKIGNDVWIGKSVTIMSGISVDNGAIIAANAVVTKNIGPYEIWGGNPAKFIKKRFSDEDIRKLLELKWWEKHDDWILINMSNLQSSEINKLYDNI